MNTKQTEKIKQATVLRDRADFELARLFNSRRSLVAALRACEVFEKEAAPWARLDTAILATNSVGLPIDSKLVDQLRDNLATLGDSNRFNIHGSDQILAQTIREMRRLARRTLKLLPTTSESLKRKDSLLYAAEIALNILGCEPSVEDGRIIHLLATAINQAGGLPNGRDSEGKPIDD